MFAAHDEMKKCWTCRLPSAAFLERECMRCLESCIRRLEAPLRSSSSSRSADSQAARLLDSLISRIERRHSAEEARAQNLAMQVRMEWTEWQASWVHGYPSWWKW